jgi:putative ABC transport system permease protein
MAIDPLPELRHALRRLARTPALALAAVLSLALGLGAASVVFEAARQLVFARPSVPAAAQVRTLALAQPASGQRMAAWSYPAYRAVRDALAPDYRAIAYTPNPAQLQLAGRDGAASRVAAEFVAPGYFEALGFPLGAGRAFGPEHDTDVEAAQVAILGHAMWREHFGADPAIVGRTITLDGHAFAVLGVLREDTRGLSEQADLWLPMAAAPRLTFANRLRGALSFWHGAFVIAPDAKLPALDARLPAAAATLQREIDFRPVFGDAALAVETRGWLEQRVDPAFATGFGLVAGCVALLLALVASNLVLLMLARVEARRAELAMRVALGAGRARVLAALAQELVWIGAAGTAAGLGLAVLLSRGLQSFGPLVRVGSTGLEGLAVGWPTVAFAAVLCLAVLGLVALGPGRQALRLGTQGVQAARQELPGAGARRRWFAGGQVFLATLLAVAAGVGVSAVWQALRVPLGFEPERVLTARVALPTALVPEDGVAGFLGRVQAGLAREGGIEALGVANCLPVRDGCDRVMLTRADGPAAERPVALNMVGGDWFGALGVPLRAGRVLDARDDAAAAPAVVLNASAAQHYFPDGDPLGRRVSISAGWPAEGTWAQVVGVVGDTLGSSLEQQGEPMVYVPLAQFSYNENFLVLRAAAGREAESLRPALEAAVRDAGAGVAAFDIATMDARFGDLTARRRLVGALLAGLAAVALVLAAAGVYAVFALLVQRRQREFGVRLALGADPRELGRRVAGEGVRVAATCAAAGAVVAGLLAWRFVPALPGYAPDALLPYLAALACTVGAAALACWLPARHAARTAPMAALRQD